MLGFAGFAFLNYTGCDIRRDAAIAGENTVRVENRDPAYAAVNASAVFQSGCKFEIPERPAFVQGFQKGCPFRAFDRCDTRKFPASATDHHACAEIPITLEFRVAHPGQSMFGIGFPKRVRCRPGEIAEPLFEQAGFVFGLFEIGNIEDNAVLHDHAVG